VLRSSTLEHKCGRCSLKSAEKSADKRNTWNWSVFSKETTLVSKGGRSDDYSCSKRGEGKETKKIKSASKVCLG